MRPQQPEAARQLRRASGPRGSSSNASGLPRVSATIRSRTRSSSLNTGPPSSSSARASPSLRPCTSSSGQVLEARRPARERRTRSRPAPPAADARRTPSVSAEAWSSHCASSMHAQRADARSADLGEQAQHGQADEEAVRSRARAAGRTPSRARHAAVPAAVEPVRAAARTAGAGRRTAAPSPTPRRRPVRRCSSDADSIRYSSSAVLPIPASPRTRTSDRLSPGRMSATKPSSIAHSLARPRRPYAGPVREDGCPCERPIVKDTVPRRERDVRSRLRTTRADPMYPGDALARSVADARSACVTLALLVVVVAAPGHARGDEPASPIEHGLRSGSGPRCARRRRRRRAVGGRRCVAARVGAADGAGLTSGCRL